METGQSVRIMGTLNNSRMMDFHHLVKFVNVKKMKATIDIPWGHFRMCQTTDNEVFTFFYIDASSCYLLDTAYGFELISLSRRGRKA